QPQGAARRGRPRRGRRQDEGGHPARVAARRWQSAGPAPHGGHRHQREPARTRARGPAARGPVEDILAVLTERIFVVFGPGGAGKGTLEQRLLERFPDLWLSRSWTTRARRPNEPEDAYTFVDRPTFERRARDGGFVEWVEFLPGHFSGTPTPDPPAGHDVLIEVDVRGAQMLRERFPDAIDFMILPPSADVLEALMRLRC